MTATDLRQDFINKLAAHDTHRTQDTLNNLDVWLGQHIHDMLDGDDDALRRMANNIDIAFSRFDESNLSDNGLDEELSRILSHLISL